LADPQNKNSRVSGQELKKSFEAEFGTDRFAVGWPQRARADLGAIFAHVAADNQSAAERAFCA
jgi:hypothetical protein